MHQESPEFLTTFRDVATTAATIFGTLAQLGRPAPSSPPPPPADEAQGPASGHAHEPGPAPDVCMLCGESSSRVVTTATARICEDCINESTRELILAQQRDAARPLVSAVCQRLSELAELAGDAIDGDGLRTLPILDEALERLTSEFRARSGPFSELLSQCLRTLTPPPGRSAAG